MSLTQLTLSHVTYRYPGTSTPVLSDVNAVFPVGWTGIIGNNGCGKTTLANIAAGIIAPDRGSVEPKLFSAYCHQDSTQPPANLADFALDWSHEAIEARKILSLEDDWFWRYDTLSGGQQKRIQIACSFFMRPDVLVMDEPTNDLDAEARIAITRTLASFKGIGILISHDRTLLDSLTKQSLLFEGGRWVIRPGGYSKARFQAESERTTTLKAKAKATKEAKRLKQEAQRRREEASRQESKKSKAGLAKGDSDGREKIGRAIYTGKDGVAGKLSTTMGRRLSRAQKTIAEQHISKRYDYRLQQIGQAARSSHVAHLEATTLHDGDFQAHIPDLWINPKDHVILLGANGTGKSLVVSALMQHIPATVKTAYIPQEVAIEERRRALARLNELPADRKGLVLSIVARLNSDPDRMADGRDVSPGELRKLMLAEQLIDEPHFLVLDEPTNHLDIGSIEALQKLLEGFPGAILLVTHDLALAASVGTIEWRMEQEGSASLLVRK